VTMEGLDHWNRNTESIMQAPCQVVFRGGSSLAPGSPSRGTGPYDTESECAMRPTQRWGRCALTHPAQRKKRSTVTVCLAASSNIGSILLAAERMVALRGEQEYGPTRASAAGFGRIVPWTASIVAMRAGETGVQAEILACRVHPALARAIGSNPARRISIH
jgi:hypothetical protein